MKKWTIYKLTSPSESIYVGKTTNLKKRISYYRQNSIKSQKKLFNSFAKYGFSSHTIEIIDSFHGTDSDSSSKEMFWIRSNMSNCCKWPEMRGLNLTDGGEGTTGYKASPEHRQRLSEMQKANPSRGRLGKKCSDEQKRILSEHNKKNPPRGRLGLKLTEEQKKKMSESRIGKPSPLKGISRKTGLPILPKIKKVRVAWNKGLPMTEQSKKALIEANKGRPCKFKGIKRWSEEEKKKMGLQNIGNTYNKGRKHSQDIVERRIAAMTGKPNVKNQVPVTYTRVKDNFVKEFASLKAANKELGIPLWAIGDSLAGRAKTPKPYIFNYKQQ